MCESRYMSLSKPTIAEMRATCQPTSVVGRRNAEHWAGRLYMRRLSIYVTRWVRDVPVSPNTMTVTMLFVGVGAGVASAWPGLLTAIAAALLVQLYLLLDCVDGEVARWRQVTSAAGVYLDRLGHYGAEAALFIGLGVRAEGGPGSLGAWSTAGAVGAVMLLLTKAESDLVVVARAGAGLPLDLDVDPGPTNASLRSLRATVGRLRLHRMIGAVELSLLLVIAAIVDRLTGSLVGTRSLVAVATAMALAVAVTHPLMILSSRRLR
jgi:phosphatidylglycerophosphate synthase